MEAVRGLLPEQIWKAMARALGREETLRLLWPALVGPNVAAQTTLRQVRGGTLVVAVAEPQWQRSLEPFAAIILEAANRVTVPWRAEVVEFVVDAPAAAAAPEAAPPRPVLRAPASPSPAARTPQEVFLASQEKYFARQKRQKELAQ